MSIHDSLGSLGAAGLVIAGMFGCAGNADYVYQPDTANVMAAGLPRRARRFGGRFHAGGPSHVVTRRR